MAHEFKIGDRVHIAPFGDPVELRDRYIRLGLGWAGPDMDIAIGKVGVIKHITQETDTLNSFRVQPDGDNWGWNWLAEDLTPLEPDPEPEPDCRCGNVSARMHGFVSGVVAAAEALFNEGSYEQAARGYRAVADLIEENIDVLEDNADHKEVG